MSPDRVFKIGEFLLGAAVLVFGMFVAVETAQMPLNVGGAGGGPKLFPFLISAGLVLVGLWLLYEGYAKAPSRETHQALELDWPPVAAIVAGFLVIILLLEPLGWIVAGTVLFLAGAYAFGSRRFLLNLLIGIGLTGLTYVIFDYGLGLDLPLGSVIENVIVPVDDGA